MDPREKAGSKQERVARALVRREAVLPDRERLRRCLAYPELGPRPLFFSGGTALRETSRVLSRFTHNSVHLITPFDSGGSSAVLRRAFAMPAVGDLRNRLIALADQGLGGNSAVAELFAHRLPREASPGALRALLEAFLDGSHPLMRQTPEPMACLARNHLRFFRERMPGDFDLAGASLGNLILAGGYFNNGRNLEATVFLFSKLVTARGEVRAAVDADLHLAAELRDGRVIVGQHLLTGKEAPAIASPVARTWLTAGLDDPSPVAVRIDESVARLIREAELVCYPVGSFYSSVTANLLPLGVAEALAANRCPKIYLPNLGHDPEEYGMGLADKVRALVGVLDRGLAATGTPGRGAELVDFVLLDAANPGYGPARDLAEVADMGVTVVEAALTAPGRRDRLDARLVVETLLSLA